jgi:hypothetical protein
LGTVLRGAITLSLAAVVDWDWAGGNGLPIPVIGNKFFSAHGLKGGRRFDVY